MASNHPIVDIRSPSVDQENSKEIKKENIEETKREEGSSDDEEGLSRSLTARRFNRSMRNVVKISKCYKAQVSLRGVIIDQGKELLPQVHQQIASEDCNHFGQKGE